MATGVERATGPFWRATRPPAAGLSCKANQFGDSRTWGSRRQVAAEHSQVGCSTRKQMGSATVPVAPVGVSPTGFRR
jgi:hypothetical protein